MTLMTTSGEKKNESGEVGDLHVVRKMRSHPRPVDVAAFRLRILRCRNTGTILTVDKW